MSEPQVNWLEIENAMLRRAAKREFFWRLYGGRSAERAPAQSVTGRMTVLPPPDHIVRLVREPNA